MRRFLFVWGAIALVLCFAYYLLTRTPALPKIITATNNESDMPFIISSPVFTQNGNIPPPYTCDGEDISPQLNFSGIPSGTASLALTMEDPDAPRGTWDHWIIWNIPPTIVRIEKGGTPPGVLGTGTGGKQGYEGPCPPDREHRYIFTLYALDSFLSLPQGSTKEDLLTVLLPHIIEKTTLVGRYNRK